MIYLKLRMACCGLRFPETQPAPPSSPTFFPSS
jgi:hypothetical protein